MRSFCICRFMGVTSTNPKFWSHSSQIIKISTITLLLVCLYFGGHFILHPVFDLHLENIYNVCLHYDEKEDPGSFVKKYIDNNLLLEMALVGIPTIAVTSATPILDAVTYRIVSGWISNSFCRRHSIWKSVGKSLILHTTMRTKHQTKFWPFWREILNIGRLLVMFK